jgi:hypothetical protein
MRLSDKQAKAVKFLADNPGADVSKVLAAAGVSLYGSNGPQFIYRLLSNGSLRLDVTPEGAEAVA